MSTVVLPSGYFLANRFGRLFLASLEETVGRNGLNALLNLSGRGSLITAPPPDDMQLAFDTASISALLAALELVYGPRGARGLAMRAGRAMFDRLVDGFELPTGFNPLAFRLLPQPTRLKIGVPALARLVTQHSDMTCRVADRGTYFEYTAERCADCWGRTSKGPVCNLTVGLLLEAMSSFGRGQEFRVAQRECRAAGAAACVFHLDKEPIA
ncbi:MAG TPA: 4-vinyl reductase [Promineifilum sp.]|nr:4-vinyl reductase [Promineifilum sp.]HQF70633.1 4-vinyl reductase [Promineifilum sp.]